MKGTNKGHDQIVNTLFFHISLYTAQYVKKVVSNSRGLVDFTIGLVNSVFYLPDGQVMFIEE